MPNEHGRSIEFAQHADDVSAVVRKPVMPRCVCGTAVPTKIEPNNPTTMRDFLRKPFPGFAARSHAVKEYDRSSVVWAVNLDVQCRCHARNNIRAERRQVI